MKQLLAVAAIAVLGWTVYLPGLPGNFVYDDFSNIVQNQSVHIDNLDIHSLSAAAGGTTAGPLKRPISMLSFALNWYFGGIDPLPYKLVNIAIHVLNGIMVFFFLGLLLKRMQPGMSVGVQSMIALASALAWTLHPINLSSVLYIVQRMNSLAALFTLLGLWVYLRGRSRPELTTTSLVAVLLAAAVFGVMAALSKENGVLLFPFLLLIELYAFKFKTNPRNQRCLVTFFALTVGLPAIGVVIFLMLNPNWLTDLYVFRDFTVGERLLTQTRVLWMYIGMLAAPSNAILGLFHDDMVLSTGLLSPPITLAAAVALIAAVAMVVITFTRAPVLSFAILWFAIGHSIESTLLPLEMAHDHRNYLPGIGPLFAVFYYLLKPHNSAQIGRAFKTSAVTIVSLFAIVTALRAEQWRDPISLALMEAQHHPNSQRARYELGRTYYLLFTIESDTALLDKAQEQFEIAAPLNAANHLPLFGLVHVAFARDQAVDEELLNRLKFRLRNHTLHPTSVFGLRRLVECNATGFCALRPDQMMDLFGSALANPRLAARDRGDMLIFLASYYSNELGEIDTALSIVKEMVTEFPNKFDYRLILIKGLMGSGRNAEALREIEQARKIPWSARRPLGAAYGPQLDALAASLQASG